MREKFSSHLSFGLFHFVDVPSQVWTLAATLSEDHTATLGTRALDVLHVATALVLKPAAFCSFDERQRKLARAKGLKVLPV